jgi:transcriptional regulator with XRE-family HTH domain
MVKARKAAGLTQRELADRLRKPPSFVAKYEGGERRIDVVEFLTVCQAIGADSAKLLKALKNAIANGNQRVWRQVDGIATRIGCRKSKSITFSYVV